MQADLLIQRPAAAVTAAGEAELLLLFHGVGSSAEDLRSLASALAPQRPKAWVVSVRSPERSDVGPGWQWFSVRGVTEENRPDRVAAAMTAFKEKIGAWQQHASVGPDRTTLVGFSQGAIMALESTQPPGPVPASGVIAIAGRFARRPLVAPVGAVVHLMHGEQDPVMPVDLAVAAHAQLQLLGARSTLDRFTGLGHGIDGRVARRIVERLEGPPCCRPHDR